MPDSNQAAGACGHAQVLPKVLVVDDNPINRETCIAMLALWGIQPDVACNGAEALQRVREQRFDLVLMDIVMPVMDGLAATEAIRRFEQEHADGRRVPVVAYSSEDIPREVLDRVGLNDALRKPTDAMTLAGCLRRWCAEKFSAR